MGEIRRRVLVVDDDDEIRDLASAVLSQEYEVMDAVDGVAGWEKARSWRPALVITDLMMPRMHGYELCKLLRGRDGLSGVKILVVSSKPFATDKAQALAAGADDYLVKPFVIDDLKNVVGKLLSSAAGAPPPPAPDEPGATKRSSFLSSVPAPTGASRIYVRFWGTRGSCPTGGVKTVRYGGNTPCTEVRVGDVPLIIDCGTGLRELGVELTREFSGRPLVGHIFVGHTHWDHIQGFPFFTPLYNPQNTFTVYSVHGARSSLRSIFSESMALDYFPVPLSSLASKLSFVELEGSVDLGVAKVHYHHLNHPGVCIGFRIEAQGTVITYLSDHEGFVKLGGDGDLSRRQDAAVVDFARGSDLLIMEAQYTEQEYSTRKGWGHGTYEDAAALAAAAGVKSLALFHHDPSHTDEIMDANVKACRDLLGAAGSKADCFAACEGLRIDYP
ncbi:MAG: response regulator [Elusimicrobia bacterium]|nr:response regulator [Elusimicrobiota bacterium]